MGDIVIAGRNIGAEPGAPNIVPGRARALIGIRSADTATIEAVGRRLQALIADIAPPTPGTRLASLTLRPVSEVEPTATDASLAEALEGLLAERQLAFERLHSMAGHDAQHAAHVCRSGMFFIPSLDGISHSPREGSREEDIALAGEVMLAWVERCAAAGVKSEE